MLRILLIILVALAVIIGLMKLTGAKPEAAGTAIEEAVATEEVATPADAPIGEIAEEPEGAAVETTDETTDALSETAEGAGEIAADADDSAAATDEAVPTEDAQEAPPNQ